MDFIPETSPTKFFEVPYFETSQENKVPGYSLSKDEDYYRNMVTENLIRLGASGVIFTPGTFPLNPPRYGFRIEFQFARTELRGRIDAAALPIKDETPARKTAAIKQCLYLVGLWLEGEYSSLMYRPGAVPLMPYLLDKEGKTFTEQMIARGYLQDVTGYYLPPIVGK